MALTHDFRIALRSLMRSPSFTLVAVAILGLGIGANTALFSVIDQLVLQKLPVRDSSRLVILDTSGASQGRWSQSSTFSNQPFSYPMYLDLKAKSPVTDDILARMPVSLSLSSGGKTDRVGGELVTGNYFQLLGVGAAAGRVLSPEDDRVKGAHPVVVLSHAAWVSRFAGDPAIVGRPINVNGQPMTVVGVALKGWKSVQVGSTPELFVPMAMKPVATPGWDDLDNRRSIYLDLVARLKPGVSLEQAKAGLQTVYTGILTAELADINVNSATFKERFVKKPLLVRPGARGASDYRGAFSRLLFTLAAMVGVVLLTVCASLANLIAARAARRRREMSVRVALGASRAALVRPLLAESLLLSALGGALGVLIANAALPALAAVLGGDDFRQALDFTIDGRMLAFSGLVAIATAFLFGSLPARDATRSDLAQRLREDGASTTATTAQLRLRRLLIGVQVAFSALVLVSALLFARSLSRLLSIDAGVNAAPALSFAVDPRLNGYSVERSRELIERITARLRQEPAIETAGVTDTGLLTDNSSSSNVEVDGYTPAEDENMNLRHATVDSEFFGAIGMPIVLGRGFTDADRQDASRVVVINQKAAQYFFKNESPLGRRIKLGRDEHWMEVVGVTRDTAWRNLREERTRNMFRPFKQVYDGDGMTVYVRAKASGAAGAGAANPAALFDTVRRVVREIDPQLPVSDLRSFEAQVAASLQTERMARTVSSAFAVVAVLLASIGLYGLLAYAVTGRSRELGLRMALGASRSAVIGLVVREGLQPVIFGLVAGLALAVPAARFVGSQLYDVQPYDLPSFLAVPPILLLAGLAAVLLPASRASRVDPARALRQD
jgi:predicted permease